MLTAGAAYSLAPYPMHGTFTHRVTCNLYPEQYFQLEEAARKCHSRVAPFLRDAGLAYLSRRFLLPPTLEKQLTGIVQEVRRVGTNLNQIAARANTLQRLTHDDLRRAAKLVQYLERQVTMLRHILQTLPHDHQVDVSQES